MTYYAGLDVSLRSIHICVIGADGEIVSEGKTGSDAPDVITFLDDAGVAISQVGLEAGTLTQYLTYGLQFAGYEVVCMEARRVKNALSAMRNKTDKNDARGIAQLLRSGWYRPVHIKSMDSHHIRALLASRKAVLDKCVDLENEIRGLFKVFGIKLPPKLGHGSFDAKVRALIEADSALRGYLLPVLDARLTLYKTFRELDNRTRHTAHDDPVRQRLMSAPGVGFVTALTFKAAVDDPTRFKHSRTVAAHFGLTPRRFQSGELDLEGHISKCGDSGVRSTLHSFQGMWLSPSKGRKCYPCARRNKVLPVCQEAQTVLTGHIVNTLSGVNGWNGSFAASHFVRLSAHKLASDGAGFHPASAKPANRQPSVATPPARVSACRRDPPAGYSPAGGASCG